MGLNYVNLDGKTRGFMVQEVQAGGHYLSPRLTEAGLAEWPILLEEATRTHTDDWIANQLLHQGHIRHQEIYVRNGNQHVRRINRPQAAQMLAEGEFNRYYLRALCLRAQAAGQAHLLIYRGKEVENPRPESEARIDTLIAVELLLEMLRTNDFVSIEQAIGVPGGPNSGLTCRLP